MEEILANYIIEIKAILTEARLQAYKAINTAMVEAYWKIGQRIVLEEQNGKERAEYGKEIIKSLSVALTAEFGKGFSKRSLWEMRQFYILFSDYQKVRTLFAQLSWSHFAEILYTKDNLAREFYLTMAASENWSIRTLRNKIDSMLYERTAISSKPEEVIKTELANLRDNEILSPDLVFKSPYFLEFTGLKGVYSEKSLEDSLLVHLEHFILELGVGFTFVERQKRMIIDGEDFYLDLLFYHRKLRRLVAIELKLGKFKAAYKGQMELYLRWLEKHEMEVGEESPIGLLLCTEGSEEQIELLQLDQTGIRVAQYMTELPSRALLHQQLQKIVAERRAFL